LTSRALGRIHFAFTRGYVFIKQSDSPCKPSSSTLEPMILPKLLIYFADFPYRPSPPCWALHPRALMRFGTTGARPFQRAAHVVRRATLPTFSPESCLRRSAAVAIRVTTQRAVPRISARFPFYRRRITSFHGRTRLCMFTKVLLLPRSAPRTPPAIPTYNLPRHTRARLPRNASGASCYRSAPSIFGAPRFGRYVITRFLADADLHGHRPAVPTAPTPSLSVLPLATYPPPRFTPPCGPCLPQAAHWRAPDSRTAQCRHTNTFGVCWHAYILSTASSCTRAAVLRDISAGTSYQTVRLVFRPYAHVLPSS